MSDFTNRLKQEFQNFFPELIQGVRGKFNEEVSFQIQEEQERNIAIATMAMLDAGISDNIVIEKLQKYWDLRRSETRSYISWAHKQLEKERDYLE